MGAHGGLDLCVDGYLASKNATLWTCVRYALREEMYICTTQVNSHTVLRLDCPISFLFYFMYISFDFYVVRLRLYGDFR